MAKKYDIRIQKTVLNKDQFDKAIDTSFKTFVDPPSELEGISISEFFNLYENLYYDIPVEGDTNSHEFLVKESGKLVNLERDTTEIQPLLDEITTLRERILDLNNDIIELQTENLTNDATD
tara:strand:+ start:251 stop:613 length:363 start_codon:yes stop_codon:yes gene_type:complete